MSRRWIEQTDIVHMSMVYLLILSSFMTQTVLQVKKKKKVLLPAFSYSECIYCSITPFVVFLMIFFWCYEGFFLFWFYFKKPPNESP